ncbi:MAG: hypothetical protein D6E12_01190 [Desulfovibrio sp.]|nr:MAG: hypothetical protein D6E12_01190 [Desulfovibrio sp.]
MKVVKGQMEIMDMVFDTSMVSDSLASTNMRTFIRAMKEQQMLAPDVLQSTVSIKPFVEQETGRLVTSVG